MARISEQSIDQVRQAADIVDVISKYVELKQKGKHFWGLCPFHSDTRATNFCVTPDMGIYKCYACGAGGNCFTFIREQENLEFVDAVKHLAENYNITLDIKGGDSKKFADTKSQIIAIHQIATDYYKEILFSDVGKDALNYLLKERELKKSLIDEFHVGFSPDSYDDLLKLLRSESFSSEAMKLSGLFIQSEKGYYNRFRSRIMFPIHDYRGNVIAFNGRIFNSDHPSKYVNSPETPIYNKSNVFYGIFQNSKHIRETKKIVLVEGQTDLIQLTQAGVNYCLAVSGTAFTNGHVNILKRYTNNIYIAFDGDDAGKKAALKCGYTLSENAIEPKIITLEDGFDPDDWIRKYGLDTFNQRLSESKGVINTHYNFFSNLNAHGSLSANEFIQECLNEIINIKDPIIREIMIKEVSELTSIDQKNILQVLNDKESRKTNYQNQNNENEVENKPTIKSNLPEKLYDDFIRLCFSKDKKIREFIFTNMNENWLLSNHHKTIYESTYIHLKGESEPAVNVIIDQIENKETKNKLIELTFDLDKIEPNHLMVVDCIIRLEQHILKNSLTELRNKLKSSDDDFDDNVLEQLNSLEKQISQLKNKYNEQ